MDKRINRVAALANLSAYDAESVKKYINGAPHIKHYSIRNLYGIAVVKVFDGAQKHTNIPTVLDLGAGEGSVTLPFLELGAKVVAVDISRSQLDTLKAKCKSYGDMLEVRCEDISETLNNNEQKYDIIVINAFLHHVPDYIGMLKNSIGILKPNGQIFSFQDPLRYDSVGKCTTLFSKIAYLSWRLFQGDVICGLQRRMRRSRGVYLEDSVHDNAEYHVLRNGVDQDAILALLEEQGLDCTILHYFSTQSSFFQRIGFFLGLKNTFGVLAQKRDTI